MTTTVLELVAGSLAFVVAVIAAIMGDAQIAVLAAIAILLVKAMP